MPQVFMGVKLLDATATNLFPSDEDATEVQGLSGALLEVHVAPALVEV